MSHTEDIDDKSPTLGTTMGIGGEAPTFGTTAGIGDNITFGMTWGNAANIWGIGDVRHHMDRGTTPTAGIAGMASISERVATITIGGFGTTGMPGTTKGVTAEGLE
jgi:hypothetical protein